MYPMPIDPAALCFRCRHRKLVRFVPDVAPVSYVGGSLFHAQCEREDFVGVGVVMLATECPLFERDRRELRFC